MRVLRAILIFFLFLASVWCLLCIWAVADLSPPDDPTAIPLACGCLVASILLGVAAIRQLSVLSCESEASEEEKCK